MSDPDAPRRFHFYQATPNKEEQARLDKLAAETALVNEQLKKAQRENVAAESEAKSLTARYWFILTPAHALQAVVAGLVLVSAFFVLYEPLVQVVGRKAENAQLAAEKAALEAAIQTKKNVQLTRENKETKDALNEREKLLKEQEGRYGSDLKKLRQDLNLVKEEKDRAIRTAENLKGQRDDLTNKYDILSQLAQTSETEKEKYRQLARKSEKAAEELTTQLVTLQSEARAAERLAARVQKQVEKLPFRNSIGMEFVYIPAGKFMMGSPDTDAEANIDEKPAHRVRITQPFYLGKYEVTQGEWQKVMGRNPSDFTGDPTRPVEKVSWDDAQAFIQKLNAKEGGTKYRLPTEAEWEYAARAGTEGPRYHTDVDAIAWYRENSNGETHVVGQKLPNAWGLYDMLGNVYEWSHDDKRSYTDTAVDDPVGSTVAGAGRVIRGGVWAGPARFVRAAARGWGGPGVRYRYVGFRCLSSGVSQAAPEAR